MNRPHVQGPTPPEVVERLVDADLFACSVEATIDRAHVLVEQAGRWQFLDRVEVAR